MAENPFVRMYRDLVRRINALPQVRLSRVDPEAPAEPAEGWALSVGRQRVALGAADISLAELSDGELSAGVRDSLQSQLAVPDPPTEWTSLPLDAGFSGGVWWCTRGGVVYLHGRVIRSAGDWPTGSFEIFATLPPAARPSRPTASPYINSHAAINTTGGPFTVTVSGSGVMSARVGAGVSTAWLEMASLSWPVTP